MFRNSYHFRTIWRVEGTTQEVYTILDEPTEFPRWWPAVYLWVRERETPQGKRFELYTKGWLPYTLRWEFRRIEKVPFERMVLEARGDFVGRGEWTLRQDGQHVEAVYDWQIEATKPLLRWGSWLLRPVFAANHRWAMRKGEESLALELCRRRARTEEERGRVPAPPGPTTTSSLPLMGAVVGVFVGLYMLIWWLLRVLI